MAARRGNSAVHDIPQRLADVLLELEASLREAGRWERQRPASRALASSLPFCIDTLTIEQWLQWVLLPRMKHLLEQREPLPTRSAIYEYGQQCLCSDDPCTARLLVLLKRFDDLIKIHSATTRFH
jgi:uncharacterized protein YqcC (DUF446 family)